MATKRMAVQPLPARASTRPDPVPPTPEQARRAIFDEQEIMDRKPGKNIVIGYAFRRRAMVDILANQGMFSDRETKALRMYRHYASLADRSLLRDSLNDQRGPKGTTSQNHDGPTIEMLTAIEVTGRCEKAVGPLRDVLRLVIVDDLSLSEVAMHRHGSVQICRNRSGKTVCRPEPTGRSLRTVKLEMKLAARKVEQEIG